MRTSFYRCIAWGGLALVLSSYADTPSPLGKRLLEPFNYQGVRLTAGRMKQQLDEVRRFYLAIPDDDLLKGFRARAGQPASGHDLGGWYSSDTFLVFGQIVSGLARLYAATGDDSCRDKANRLIAEWAKCIEPDGYFYASRKPNAPHYIYDKMLWGLLDSYLYCGNEKALTHLGRITDWATKNLDRSRRINDTSTEWYTLSENLYRAYLATGDPKYGDFAHVWEYHDYWGIYALGGDIFAPRTNGVRTEAYHAYSHVNTLGGAGAAFLVTGKRQYLDTLINASAYLETHQCFATGGYGPDEQLLPKEKLLEKLSQTHNSFETQCGSWAVFKLAKYLISFTGDARYGDWVERLAINGLGASLPMTSDGRVFYYSDYCPFGGTKRNTDFGWSCCTGTRPQAIADYSDLIYFHDSDHLHVNLFTSSTLKWVRADETIWLRQTTSFPEADKVHFRIELGKPAEFALVFRVPGWLAEPMSATVNGRKAQLRRDEKHWAGLRRRWRNGDKIELRLPMKVWASPLDPERPVPAAALIGPVVLGFEAPSARAMRQVHLDHLTQDLQLADHSSLQLKFVPDPAIKARPFYRFDAGQRYFVYLDTSIGARIPYTEVKFTGDWKDAGAFRFSNEIDATAECDFEGLGFAGLAGASTTPGGQRLQSTGRL